MKLNRRFSPTHLFTISINGMIGSAWLFAPLYSAKIAGNGSIIAWILGGLATALIALTFAELSTLFPVAGGTARIPELSHGITASFFMSWLAWLSSLTIAPIEVQAILQYAATYFHALIHTVNGIPVLTGLGLICATLLMFLMSFINIVSFRGLVRFNTVLIVFKVLVIIIAVTTLMRISYHPDNFYVPLQGSRWGSWHAILSAIATGGIAFAFTGFKHGVELAGEAKNKSLGIPLAIVGSVMFCLVLYVALQMAFISALEPRLLLNGWANIHFSGDVGPFAGLAGALGIMWLLHLLYLDAAVSPLGAGLIYVTSTARILYAMSKIGFMPKFLLKLNSQDFPVAAIWVNFILGMLLFLPLPGWQSMVSFLVSGMVLSYAMGPIALLCLRRDLPDANVKRTFRLPCAEVLCPLAFYFCNLICYWTGWNTIWKLSIAMFVGMLFFVQAYLRDQLHHRDLAMKSVLWIVPYFSGLGLISYLGTFGGIEVISFGWDFLVIALFSLLIFTMAIMTRSKNILTSYNEFLLSDEYE